MKLTKIMMLASVTLLLFACEKEEVIINDSLEKTAVSAKSAVNNGNSFLVLANSNKVTGKMIKDLALADGNVTSVISEVGIAVVSSDDPNFKSNASKIKGVQSVVPNLRSQYLNPNEKNVSYEEDFGNPPASLDDDFFFDLQWGHDAVDAPEAWNAGYRGAGVRVGVLDTGFDLTHPDLAPNINYALSADMTGQGLQYTLPNTFSHGTHTAGTIAAADNGFGTIGIAPEVELVLIKVLFDEGSGNTADILNGIIYATLNDVDVINMSIGVSFEKSGNVEDGYTASEAAAFKNIYSRVITFAYQNGTTVITSAGNEATDYDHSADLIHLPSGANHAISISATAPIGWVANPPSPSLDFFTSYSNYGQSAIDFAAPGGDTLYPGNELCNVAGIVNPCWVFDLVFSTGNGGWYWSAGTSMAAPHATGVAALIIGKNGGSMKPSQVERELRASADDLGKPGNDDFYGAGRVNAYNAVK